MHKTDRSFFLETINEWEQDFHEKNPLYYANHLFANYTFMKVLDRCMDFGNDEQCGVDLIDGKVDLDTSLEISKKSPVQTIFALGAFHDDDEALFLMIDDKLDNGTVLLSYLPEDDEDDNDTEDVNVPDKFRVKKN